MVRSSSQEPTRIPEFDWFVPNPPSPKFTITILNDFSLNLNQKLCAQLPKHIKIGVSSNGHCLGLVGGGENDFYVLKNGSIKDSELIHNIKIRGVRLPAYYLAEKIDEYWIAKLVPPTTPLSSLNKTPKTPRTPRTPRKNGLKAMLPAGK